MEFSVQLTKPVAPTVNTVTIVLTKMEAVNLKTQLVGCSGYMLARLWDALACFDLR